MTESAESCSSCCGALFLLTLAPRCFHHWCLCSFLCHSCILFFSAIGYCQLLAVCDEDGYVYIFNTRQGSMIAGSPCIKSEYEWDGGGRPDVISECAIKVGLHSNDY